MLFNSIEFYVFFPVVTIGFFLLPHRFRWMLLLAASCLFYMAFIPKYILILAITIVVDFFVGLQLGRMEGRRKKAFLVLSILCNVGFLFFFKYFNFFNTNLASLAHFLHWNYPIENLSIILPIGLSFHTFQSMSYIIEVYKGQQEPERNFGLYALYVMFYPQLVAGPIERPYNLLNALHEEKTYDEARVADGMRLMVWGMFKKVVIADNLALIVDEVYNHPAGYKGLPILIATYFFAFQIFCDFSGYTDIARGAARVMGFHLMRNFDRPYLSKSISEFWKRWHISLSSWFRDYVYIPLGGSRAGLWKTYRNTMVVFLLSGLWHGAKWTFVIWGGLNGVYLIASMLTKDVRAGFYRKLPFLDRPWIRKYVGVGVTFHLICLSWIFFRANSTSDAFLLLRNLFGGLAFPRFQYRGAGFDMLLGFALIGFLLVVQLVQRRHRIGDMLKRRSVLVSWAACGAGVLAIVLLGVTKANMFIYFQF